MSSCLSSNSTSCLWCLKMTEQSERDLFQNEILQLLPASKILGIEIGVFCGETSAFFLSIAPEVHVIGIDPIIPDSMGGCDCIGNKEQIFAEVETQKDRFELIEDYSYNVHDRFEDGTVDFIFIDGDHNYEAVKRDFELYYPKVREDGLIFFHDSRMNRGGTAHWPGPSKFVDELRETNLLLAGPEACTLSAFRKRS